MLREAQERHARELRLLQDRHRQHLVSLTAELQARHQADTAELRAALERQNCTLSGERAAESQEERAAEVRALEARHQSDLESAEARHRCELEALRSEHRRALELLQAGREGQLHSHLSPEHAASTPEFEGLERECDTELQSAEACQGAEPGAECPESLRVPAARPGGAQQVRLVLPLPAQASPCFHVFAARCVSKAVHLSDCQCLCRPACIKPTTIGSDFGWRPVRLKGLFDCRLLGRGCGPLIAAEGASDLTGFGVLLASARLSPCGCLMS